MLEPGQILQKRFAIERVLGQGGMGAVYLARHLALGGRPMAIKEMTVTISDPAQRTQALLQFQKEAQIVAALEHPNLVRVQDFFEEAGQQYLVMDYVDGRNLEDLMVEHDGFLPTASVYDWADQVLNVLQYLHSNVPPVLFRDLKPSNILVDGKGQIRLIDFGIARVLDVNSQTSTFIHGAGTAGFAPIEQYTGATDARTDIYAFGATLYTLLTRTIPPLSIALLSGEAKLPAPRSLNPSLSVELEACILRMMALRREDRFSSAAEAGLALREARQGGTSRVCGTCQRPLIPGAVFCGECGARQGTEPVIAGTSTARTPGGGRVETDKIRKPLPETAVAPRAAKAGRSFPWRLIGCGLILLSLVLFLIALGSDTPEPAASPSPSESSTDTTVVVPTVPATESSTTSPESPSVSPTHPPSPPGIDKAALQNELEACYWKQQQAFENRDLAAYMRTLSPACIFRYKDGSVMRYAQIHAYFVVMLRHTESCIVRIRIKSLKLSGSKAIARIHNESTVVLRDPMGHVHHLKVDGTGVDTWGHSSSGWQQLEFQEEETTTWRDGQVVHQ